MLGRMVAIGVVALAMAYVVARAMSALADVSTVLERGI